MATILRVKRRNIDEPSDTLVIACKKQKTDDDSTEKDDPDDMTAVVKLAGTVNNQDDVVKQIAKTLNKEDLKTNYKHNPINITAKNRLLARENSKQNRYKVINCFRSLDTDKEIFDEKRMTVIDVEDSISCTTQNISSDNKDNDYVYDLYYTETEQEMAPDNLFSIYMPNENLVFDNFRENSDHSDTCDSEDSNSESNWRNDYPDTEHSNESIDDDDIRLAVQRIKIEGEESDLSDDNSEFVYTVDEADVDNFGYKYALYKAKIIEEYENSDSERSDFSGVYISEVDDDDDKKESDNDDN